MAVGKKHLCALYAETDDPWNFRHSDYEQAKFAATLQALSRNRYRHAFELGCGNGQLARHLAGLCDRYTGMDAVAIAVEAARRAVPTATFIQDFYPCPLPNENFDLLILSEILYFLDRASLRGLARGIADSWPETEIICVTWRGPTGNALEGEDALQIFMNALATHSFTRRIRTKDYRIDRGLPKDCA
ncbi:SAM-dependent methyltransferase [Cribrihabitans pelagius]|uniref:SAM-dependent methyltransferase n=1 Tax=Cribrihabitans pelagius TaxID=1765746 RepID=UPI003B5CC3E2